MISRKQWRKHLRSVLGVMISEDLDRHASFLLRNKIQERAFPKINRMIKDESWWLLWVDMEERWYET